MDRIIDLYDGICRVCMDRSTNLQNMKEISQECGLSFAEMLEKVVAQELLFPIPEEMCGPCMELLNMAYRFHSLCLVANEEFSRMWSSVNAKTGGVEQEEEVKVVALESGNLDMDPIKLEEDIQVIKANKYLGDGVAGICDHENMIDKRELCPYNTGIEETDRKMSKGDNTEDDDDEDVPLSVFVKRQNPLNKNQIEAVGEEENMRYTNHRRKHKCKRVLPNALHYEMLQKHKRGKHKSSPKAKIKSDIIGVNEKSTTAENFDGRILDAEIVNEGDSNSGENYAELDGDVTDSDSSDNDLHDNHPMKSRSLTAFNDYPCPECKASFRFEKQLQRHIKKHTEAHRFVCIVCNDRFKYPFMLQKHTERHHPEESVKPKVVENKKDTLERNHSCNYCSSAYTNVGGLAQHMSKKHPEIVPFKCDKCDKTFVVEEHLKIHTNRHMGIKNFKCELCDKSFSFKFAMKQHMRIHTGDLNYLCTLCGKKFYRPSNLRQHMQRHGDEKPYSCPHCPKRFKCPSDRYIHLMSHQQGKNHVCSTCGARFSRVDTLHQHQILHTGEKPYKCDQCPMAFPRLMNLNRHLRTHTGEKPYKCKYCSKKYAQSNDLNKHLRTHIGENTYVCKQCPSAFKYQADLRNHEWEHYRKLKEEKLCANEDVGIKDMTTTAEIAMECNK